MYFHKVCLSFLIVLVTATVFYTDAVPLSAEDPKMAADTIQFNLVGTIGGKSYFETNLTEKVNWLGARSICEDYGKMDLASVRNSEEFKYIYNTRKGNDYWIAASPKGFGSDPISGTYKSFEWTDETELPLSYEINFIHISSFWVCLYVSGDDHTYPDFCINGSHQVLCEVKN